MKRSWLARHPVGFMALYSIFYLSVFHYLESNVPLRSILVHCRLDDLIPFCKYALIQRRGQHGVARQCNGHAGEQRQAQPPEVLARSFPQQIEQGEGDPNEPCKVGDQRIFAERDQIVQTAVHQNAAQGDV